LPAGFVNDARHRLQEQRAFRIAQLIRLDATADATSGATSDAARDEVDATLREAARLVLALVDAALCRIDQGSYGRCQRCGEEMSLERLAALPMSTWCGSCQHTEEMAGVEPGRGPEELRDAPSDL
jgi:RNA polymerase-binding transcription factor DksA